LAFGTDLGCAAAANATAQIMSMTFFIPLSSYFSFSYSYK
jgi:hypothetical protein